MRPAVRSEVARGGRIASSTFPATLQATSASERPRGRLELSKRRLEQLGGALRAEALAQRMPRAPAKAVRTRTRGTRGTAQAERVGHSRSERPANREPRDTAPCAPAFERNRPPQAPSAGSDVFGPAPAASVAPRCGATGERDGGRRCLHSAWELHQSHAADQPQRLVADRALRSADVHRYRHCRVPRVLRGGPDARQPRGRVELLRHGYVDVHATARRHRHARDGPNVRMEPGSLALLAAAVLFAAQRQHRAG